MAVAPFHLQGGRPTLPEEEHGRQPIENPLGTVQSLEVTTEGLGPQGSRASPLTPRRLFGAPRATQTDGFAFIIMVTAISLAPLAGQRLNRRSGRIPHLDSSDYAIAPGHSENTLACGRRGIYSPSSLQVTSGQEVLQLLGIRPEKSPSRPLAHRLGRLDSGQEGRFPENGTPAL